MKLSTNIDFTKLPRAEKMVRAHGASILPPPFSAVTLEHDERHLRRKVLTLSNGEKVLVDLPEAFALEHGDRLVLDDGRNVEIIAADEELYEIRAGKRTPLNHLAWYLGNRHLAAQIDEDRILICRDHVIRDMLAGLGATVTEISAPFQPVYGAYHSHGEYGHHGHSHGHGELDKFGRQPGDPHYGHKHA